MPQDHVKPDAEDAALLRAVDESMVGAPPDVSPDAGPEARPATGGPQTSPDPAPYTPEPSPAPAPEPVGLPTARGGSGAVATFLALVLGGALCAAGGYAAARFDLLPGLLPTGATAAPDAKLAADLTAQAQEIAALKALVTAMPAPADDPALSARIAALEGAPKPDTAALSAKVDTLTAQIAALSQASQGAAAADPAEMAQLRADVQALKAGGGVQVEQALAGVQEKIDAAGKAAEEISARAEAAAQKSVAAAAAGRLSAALDTGLPFGSALADLGVPVPPVLQEAAGTGLPTLAVLRDAFPAAARAGLEAALKGDMGQSWTDRFGNFLRSQTGARSLTPREGSDPDAILSRAEAALAGGDTAAALAEVKGLSEPAQAAMKEWTDLAERRIAAEEAIAKIATEIGGE